MDKIIAAKFAAFVAIAKLERSAAEFTAIELLPVQELRKLARDVDAKLAECERLLVTAETGDAHQVGAPVRISNVVGEYAGSWNGKTGVIDAKLADDRFVVNMGAYSVEFGRRTLEVIG
jgi:hypothetical protein